MGEVANAIAMLPVLDPLRRRKHNLETHFREGVPSSTWMAGLIGVAVGRLLAFPQYSSSAGLAILVGVSIQLMQAVHSGEVPYDDGYLRFLCLGACLGAIEGLPLWPLLAVVLLRDYANAPARRDARATTALQIRWRMFASGVLRAVGMIN